MGGRMQSKGHVGGSMHSYLSANLERLARENVSVICVCQDKEMLKNPTDVQPKEGDWCGGARTSRDGTGTCAIVPTGPCDAETQ